jgi:electron transport complex protein RnfB
VHCVSNVIEGVFYVCNCCGCCCGILRGITRYGIEHSVARANYYATIDQDICTNCGICVERCQVNAISYQEEGTAVDRRRCIGCGLCVTGCTAGAARLEKLPDAEMVHPPQDFDAWDHERMKNRRSNSH